LHRLEPGRAELSLGQGCLLTNHIRYRMRPVLPPRERRDAEGGYEDHGQDAQHFWRPRSKERLLDQV
jgi:hypothetical protein